MYYKIGKPYVQLGKSQNCNNEHQDMRTIKIMLKNVKKSSQCKLALKTKE